jgi:hypothetical protein
MRVSCACVVTWNKSEVEFAGMTYEKNTKLAVLRKVASSNTRRYYPCNLMSAGIFSNEYIII